MKFTLIALCVVVVLAVAQAKPLAVQQGFDIFSIFKQVLTAVSEVAGTVVAVVEEKVVAPIQNKITSTGLSLAIDQFCGLLPTIVAPMGFTLPANSKNICINAAKEELRKGFDSNWREPARA